MPDSATTSHYDRLGVRPTASPQQIRQAFREMSKLYHPDTTELSAPVATEKFQQINDAYGVLSNPERRWLYDQQMGYSRISVMRPLEPLYRASASPTPKRTYTANLYLDPNDRPLSAGELFALFILGLTFLACLALVITIGVTQSEALVMPSAPKATPEEVVESVVVDSTLDLDMESTVVASPPGGTVDHAAADVAPEPRPSLEP